VVETGRADGAGVVEDGERTGSTEGASVVETGGADGREREGAGVVETGEADEKERDGAGVVMLSCILGNAMMTVFSFPASYFLECFFRWRLDAK
jgi:hypothetical protein